VKEKAPEVEKDKEWEIHGIATEICNEVKRVREQVTPSLKKKKRERPKD